MSPLEPLAKPLGILGGTFDPVHNGHLAMALAVAEKLAVDDVRLMPNPQPPHRGQPVLAPETRIKALQLALQAEPRLSLEMSEWQALSADEERPAYSVDSLRRLRELYPRRPLVFVMGADAYAGIDSWYQVNDLPRLCHLVVVNRPGYSDAYQGLAADWLSQYAVTATNDINQCLAGSVRQLTVPEVDISATDIRRLIDAGKTPKGLVPEAILKFLEPTYDCKSS